MFILTPSMQALECCSWLGVRHCSVYAFSIENFKRPKEEVDTLMDLAVDKFQYLVEKK